MPPVCSFPMLTVHYRIIVTPPVVDHHEGVLKKGENLIFLLYPSFNLPFSEWYFESLLYARLIWVPVYKQPELPENDEMTKPDSSTVSPGDENNNSHNKTRRKPSATCRSTVCRNKKSEKKVGGLPSTKSTETVGTTPSTASSSQPNLSVVQVGFFLYLRL